MPSRKVKTIGSILGGLTVFVAGMYIVYEVMQIDDSHDELLSTLLNTMTGPICDIFYGKWQQGDPTAGVNNNCDVDCSPIPAFNNSAIAAVSAGSETWNATMAMAGELAEHLGHGVYNASASTAEQMSQVLTATAWQICKIENTVNNQTFILGALFFATIGACSSFAAYSTLQCVRDRANENRNTWGEWFTNGVSSAASGVASCASGACSYAGSFFSGGSSSDEGKALLSVPAHEDRATTYHATNV